MRIGIPREIKTLEGRVALVPGACAELVAPYPPGIPVLAPGERITEEALDALEQARQAGVRIAYAADASLATVRVTAATVLP